MEGREPAKTEEAEAASVLALEERASSDPEWRRRRRPDSFPAALALGFRAAVQARASRQ